MRVWAKFPRARKFGITDLVHSWASLQVTWCSIMRSLNLFQIKGMYIYNPYAQSKSKVSVHKHLSQSPNITR